jgi:hypothetical protein
METRDVDGLAIRNSQYIYDMMTGVYLYTIPVRLADVLLIAVRTFLSLKGVDASDESILSRSPPSGE